MKRVCRTFNEIILTSPTLQRKLFLRVVSDANVTPWAMDFDRTILVGKKAIEYVKSDDAVQKAVSSSWPFMRPSYPHVVYPYIYNPLVLRKKAMDEQGGLATWLYVSHPYPLGNRLYLAINHKSDTLDINASCRSMFLSQPPVTKVKIAIHGCHGSSLPANHPCSWTWCYIIILENEAGVTFGEVFDRIKHEARRSGKAIHAYLQFVNVVAVSPAQKAYVEAVGVLPSGEDPWNALNRIDKGKLEQDDRTKVKTDKKVKWVPLKF